MRYNYSIIAGIVGLVGLTACQTTDGDIQNMGLDPMAEIYPYLDFDYACNPSHFQGNVCQDLSGRLFIQGNEGGGVVVKPSALTRKRGSELFSDAAFGNTTLTLSASPQLGQGHGWDVSGISVQVRVETMSNQSPNDAHHGEILEFHVELRPGISTIQLDHDLGNLRLTYAPNPSVIPLHACSPSMRDRKAELRCQP